MESLRDILNYKEKEWKTIRKNLKMNSKEGFIFG